MYAAGQNYEAAARKDFETQQEKLQTVEGQFISD